MRVVVSVLDDEGYRVKVGEYGSVMEVPGEFRGVVVEMLGDGVGVRQVGDYIVEVIGGDGGKFGELERIVREWGWT